MEHDENESRRNMVESLKYIEGTSRDYAEIVREINYHQYDLREYIVKLCIKKYNSIGGGNIDNLAVSVRNTINKIINGDIMIEFPDINRRNANRAQHSAAHSNVNQPLICYICGGACPHPHVEHVIRIIQLYLLTGHLDLHNPIKAASLRYAHSTCNVIVKGSINFFQIYVENNFVKLQAMPVSETRFSERFESATRTLSPFPSRPGSERDAKNPNTHYVHRPVDADEIILGDPSSNVNAVTFELEQLFNTQHVSPKQVVFNLKNIYDACIPPLNEIFDQIQKQAIEETTKKSKGFRKKTKRIKKIIRRRPTNANKTRNKRT
jgi:hypothetical protein